MPCGCHKSKKNESQKNIVKKVEAPKKLQINTIKRPIKKVLNNAGKK
jgi:hypothetical protein